MAILAATIILLLLTFAGYRMGRAHALATVGGDATRLLAVPGFHGTYVALWMLVPALVVLALWLVFGGWLIERLTLSELPASLQGWPRSLVVGRIRSLAEGAPVLPGTDPALIEAARQFRMIETVGASLAGLLALAMAVAGGLWARRAIGPRFRARRRVERVFDIFMIIAAAIAILTTVGIVFSLLFEALRFFSRVPLTEFLFGLQWSPQTAIRADQLGASEGAFGAVPLFTGTLLISTIALAVAVPVGLMAAVYMSEYAGPRMRALTKPVLEVLAGIPTVVFGFFAALTLAPLIADLGNLVGFDVSAQSALAAGLVMGVMIIPLVSSLSDDVINAVPQTLRDGALALGATDAEVVRKVVLPAALPGLVGAVLLAVSRAVGETMIVVMAAGLFGNLTANPFAAVTTVTVQIATMLVGDQEFDSAKTLSAFALGLVLFIVTLLLNVAALRVVQRYREAYE